MPFAFMGEEMRTFFIEEDDVLVRNVGVDRNLVSGEIMIDEEAEPLVDHELLHQRRTHPHGHRPDDLTACGLGLRIRPEAQTASMRRTRIWPVAELTATSTKCAAKVNS